MNNQLKTLLNKVNKVTSYHRHGNPIPNKALDELANAHLEYEEAIERDRSQQINEWRTW